MRLFLVCILVLLAVSQSAIGVDDTVYVANYPLEKKLVKGWRMKSGIGCATVTLGDWLVLTPPKYGTTSSEIISSTSDDCPGTYQYNMLTYTWTSKDKTKRNDYFTARWKGVNGATTRVNTVTVNITMVPPTATISSPDITTGKLVVKLVDATNGNLNGNIELIVIDSLNSEKSFFTTAQPSKGGTHEIAFDRTSLVRGEYKSLKARWKTNWLPVEATKITLSPSWKVLGTVRHTQYNTPSQVDCPGTATVDVWLYDTACNFVKATLKSSFIAETIENGTGRIEGGQLIKPGNVNGGVVFDFCPNKYPPGANQSNSYLKVNSITGACNSSIGSSSQAVFPSPRDADGILQPRCRDSTTLVNDDSTTAHQKKVHDFCPACSESHIDNWNSAQKCRARGQVLDLGTFWTSTKG